MYILLFTNLVTCNTVIFPTLGNEMVWAPGPGAVCKDEKGTGCVAMHIMSYGVKTICPAQPQPALSCC